MLIKYLRSLLSLFVAKKETAFIASQPMPSSTVVFHDDEEYFIAPSDGWAYGNINVAMGQSGWVSLKVTNKGYVDQKTYDNQKQGGQKTAFLPVSKGDKVALTTNFTGYGFRYFRFISANGS